MLFYFHFNVGVIPVIILIYAKFINNFNILFKRLASEPEFNAPSFGDKISHGVIFLYINYSNVFCDFKINTIFSQLYFKLTIDFPNYPLHLLANFLGIILAKTSLCSKT